MNAAQLQPSINLLRHSAEMSDVYGEMEGSWLPEFHFAMTNMGKVDSLQLVADLQTRLKVAFKHLKRLHISIRLIATMFRNKQSSQMSFCFG